MAELQAVFIDRDGTIGGTGHFIHPDDFELFPSAQEDIHSLKTEGMKVFAFTNQTHIAKGHATLEEFKQQFQHFGFDQAYICPHDPDSDCDCRKPQPGMLLKAAREHGLDLTKCAVIGDTGGSDMLAAAVVGAMKILVRTGWGESSLSKFRYTWSDVEPDYIAKDIDEAVRWILNKT